MALVTASGRSASRARSIVANSPLRASPLCELERPLCPWACLFAPPLGIDREGVVLPGRRELSAGWQLLEDRHGLRPRDCRLLRAPGAPENLRQPAQRVALTETVADSAMTLARFLDRLDGGVALIRHVALARA